MIVSTLRVCVVLLLWCLCWFCFQPDLVHGNAGRHVLISGILPLPFAKRSVYICVRNHGIHVSFFGRAKCPGGSIGSKRRDGSLGTRGRICLPHPSGCHQSSLLHPGISRQRLGIPDTYCLVLREQAQAYVHYVNNYSGGWKTEFLEWETRK